jgi:hypothetical protein
MPSKIKRRTPAGTWVDVADFDLMAQGSKWFTGTGDPTGPAVDSFYIDMANKNIWYRLDNSGAWENVGNISDWNSAWGIQKRGTLWNAGTSAPIPAQGQPFSLQDIAWVELNPVAGRLYRFTIFIRAIAPNSGSGDILCWLNMKRNGVSLQSALGDPWFRSSNNYNSLNIEFLATAAQLTAGTLATFYCHLNNSGPELRVWMDSASHWIVEDVGPDRG